MLFQKKESRVFQLVSKLLSIYIYIYHLFLLPFQYQVVRLLCWIVTVVIGLHTTFETREISWKLSPNCASQSSLSVASNAYYESKCSLALGQSYTLNCKSFTGSGWNSNYLIIENTAYCENFSTGFEETTNITIKGSYNSMNNVQ